MAEASNATESRLSSFIKGCSQLQEIYAVAPLTYTNIMGEWWQRINDIIYTLGLTETESTVVNIAWTVPEIGRKRSPFFVEELSTKKSDGTYVLESSRTSTVAGDGTGQVKAHKYGLIQSVDKLFQRNINTWGDVDGQGLYEYFWNQQHTNGAKPKTLTEMIFGQTGISNSGITSLYNDATRNLTGDNKGLANSLKHIIEDIFGSSCYDWLDNLSSVEGPDGLQEFFFSDRTDFSNIFDRMTTGGVVTESVKLIDTIGLDFYNWLNSLGEPVSIQQFLFGNESDFDSIWDRLTTNGLATETVKIVDTIGEDLYNWLNDAGKLCAVKDYETYCVMHQYNNRKWNKLSIVDVEDGDSVSNKLNYLGQINLSASLPIPQDDNGNPILYDPSNATSKEELEIALQTNFVTNALSHLSVAQKTRNVNDIYYIVINFIFNEGLSKPQQCARHAYFVCYAKTNNVASWGMVAGSYSNAIAGMYDQPAYSTASPANNKLCLVKVTDTILYNEQEAGNVDERHGPKSLSELLFGDLLDNESICEVFSNLKSGSILGETERLKDVIGEDFIDYLEDNDLRCISENGSQTVSKSGPHNLKDLLFGSMSTEEFCETLKGLSGQSIFSEIKNIITYLGPTYNSYTTTINNPSETPVDKEDSTINPLVVLQTISPGQVLFGSTPVKDSSGVEHATYINDYILKTGYICDTTKEADDTKNSLTDQKRIFNEYQRVGYSPTGTKFQLDANSDNIIYYFKDKNRLFPFMSVRDCKTIVETTSPADYWPNKAMPLQDEVADDGSLRDIGYYIYNSSNDTAWALMDFYKDVDYDQGSFPGQYPKQDYPALIKKLNRNREDLMPTASMTYRINSEDAKLTYSKEKFVKSWNLVSNSSVGNIANKLWTYLFVDNLYTVDNDWVDDIAAANPIWTVKSGFWAFPGSILKAGTVLAAGSIVSEGTTKTTTVTNIDADTTLTQFWYIAAGSKIAKSSKFYYDLNVVMEKSAIYKGHEGESDYIPPNHGADPTSYKFLNKDHDVIYYRNASMTYEWWTETSYSNNFYRRHFTYPKENFFHVTPQIMRDLEIGVKVYSEGSSVDTACWDYDDSRNLILLGENSVRHTGFLSNKKFLNYYLETCPNSDTDDDDFMGVMIGGYKDPDSGVINNVSIHRCYQDNAPIYLSYNASGYTPDNKFFTLDTQDANIKVRAINGKYGYYINASTEEEVARSYDGFFKGDPKVAFPDPETNDDNPTYSSSTGEWTFPTMESGYYETRYTLTHGSITLSNDSRYAFINKTKTIYQDTFIGRGPSTRSSATITINSNTGCEENGTAVVYPTGTPINSGRYSIKDPSQVHIKNWNNVSLIIKAMLDIIKKNGLIFARSGLSADAALGASDMQHILPYHLSTTTFADWWDGKNSIAAISSGIKSQILASIKNIFAAYTTSGALVDWNTDANSDTIALEILKAVFNKFELSTLNFSSLKLDDIFKLRVCIGRVRAITRDQPDFTTHLIELGFVTGYGVLNAYSKYNLNSKYIVTKNPNKIKIVYKDIFHQIDGVNGNNDPGIEYINTRYPYRGDIEITLTYNAQSNKVDIVMNQTDPHQTDINGKPITRTKTVSSSSNAILLNVVKNNTSYGFTADSNPLSNFKENIFVDIDASTIYDLESNQKYYIDSNYHYQQAQTDCITEIYRDFGPGRLISNDISEKLYYTRGDSNILQKLVDSNALSIAIENTTEELTSLLNNQINAEITAYDTNLKSYIGDYTTRELYGLTKVTATTFSGELSGNASTATQLETAIDINISDADGTNTGTKISFDGSSDVTIKLPSTIKASITGDCSGSSGSCTGNAETATTASKLGTSTVGSSSQLIYLNSGIATPGINFSWGTGNPSGGSNGDIYFKYID